MTKDEIFTLASEKLGNISSDDLEQNSKLIDNVGYYFGEPIRGGKQFIIGFDGGYLFATSAVPFDQHLEAYIAGKRSDPTT